MRIRSKLLTLIVVPLIALTLVAAFGFSNQSAAIEAAEAAEVTVAETQAVQNAVLAIGNERILTAGGSTNALASATKTTNAAIGVLVDLADSNPQAGSAGRTAAELVGSARANGDDSLGLYGLAIESLTKLQIDSAENYPTASARNVAVVNQAAGEALQLRERAWISYFQLEEINNRGDLDPDAVAAVVADFAVAENTLRTAVRLAEAGRADSYNTVLQTNSAVQLGQLEVAAVDDLNEGEVSVAPEAALSALIDFRTRWSGAIVEQGTTLRSDVANALNRANDLRSLFSLLAILGSIVLAALIFVMSRSITGPLDSLLTRASAVADEELPELVNALRLADRYDELPTAVPIPVVSDDEIGELVEAFNNMQTTAYDLATEQALSRRNVADMFVNLGRRNQQLLQRILGRLTDLEQHEEDPDQLAELFELDNIVTRMRRNAESLLALAGAQTTRQWSQPVEMQNTVRAAFGEVEGYERINVASLADTMVTGRVVADVTHLLAELLENALNFSDSQTAVEVNGLVSRGGYLITISDQGIGMAPGELAEYNSRITDPPPLDQVPTRFLGLYVVGRLAQRHGIEVRLSEGEVRGTVARVLLPESVLAADDHVDELDPVDHDESDSHEADADEAHEVDIDSVDADEAEADEVESDLVAVDDTDDTDDTDDDDDDADSEADVESEPAAEAVTESGLAIRPVNRDTTEEEQSPLEESHDLDGELAALTESSDTGSALPVRNRDGGSSDADPSAGDDAESAIGGLPVRKRGDSLEQAPAAEIPKVNANERKAAETSTEAASGFSSMLSAFSSGISLGLEAVDEEEPMKGED